MISLLIIKQFYEIIYDIKRFDLIYERIHDLNDFIFFKSIIWIKTMIPEDQQRMVTGIFVSLPVSFLLPYINNIFFKK